MNKNLILIAALLALSLPWVGCNKSGKLDTASTFKPPSGPVELKLKWPLGERIVQDMDMKQNMELSMPGQPAPMKQDMTMGQEYGLTVLKENPDGGHEVEMEFLSARMGDGDGGQDGAGLRFGQKIIGGQGESRWPTCSEKSSAPKSSISWMPATRSSGSKAWMNW